jgi:hypothetical protein
MTRRLLIVVAVASCGGAPRAASPACWAMYDDARKGAAREAFVARERAEQAAAEAFTRCAE